jgi:hypothetical protein
MWLNNVPIVGQSPTVVAFGDTSNWNGVNISWKHQSPWFLNKIAMIKIPIKGTIVEAAMICA